MDNTKQYICSQESCLNPPKFRCTWPGQDEQFVCEEHAKHHAIVALSLSVPLQMIPVMIGTD